MPPKKTRAQCQICQEVESRYTCPGSGCLTDYCSVSCYKRHKDSCGSKTAETAETQDVNAKTTSSEGDEITKEIPLRPLTSLKWPYVPEQSAYPDPLKRDDPKPLQTAQYEAIASSPAIRAVLREHTTLKETLRRIDGMQGSAREEALQASLGIGQQGEPGGNDAMRELAEAIETAVRGNRDGNGLLGLDWTEGCPERE